MSAPSWAVPGAKVVCIDDRYRENFADDIQRPVVGHVYTVREALMKRGKPQILLVEIRNHVGDYERGRFEASFHTARFRPITTRTIDDDMEHFLPLLNTVGEDA